MSLNLYTEKWLNDIALVKLKEEVPSQPSHVADIQQVALATQGDSSFPQDGQQCVFKGWGCRGHGRYRTDSSVCSRAGVVGLTVGTGRTAVCVQGLGLSGSR